MFTKKVAASYKSPRIIDFVSELPKTISGKIRRATIRDKDAEAQKAENAENAETSTTPAQSHPDESQDRHS